MNRRDFLKTGACGLLGVAAGCGRRPQDTDNGRGPEGAVVSPWARQAGRGRIECTLCPKRCILARGERGACRVRLNREDALITLAYGNPALVLEDVIERTPFFHVLPASRALSLATPGCNLACRFCEVWDMALVPPEDVPVYDMTPEAAIAHAQASGVRSISYGFGEPTVFYEYMTAIADQARRAGLLNLLHTAGSIEPAPLDELLERIDAVNIDLKGFDPDFYREKVGGELDPVLRTLQRVKAAGKHLEITTILIPSLNDDMALFERMCRWIVDTLGADVPLHIARFYPLYRLANLPQTPVSTLDKARTVARATGLKFVYVARVTGHEGENTFCPNCDATVVARTGYIVDALHLNDQGHCETCGTSIPGRWH